MSDVRELRDLAQRVSGLAVGTRGAAAHMRDAQGVDFVSDAAERHHPGGLDFARRLVP
jgi:hypothetical protein